MHNWKMGIAAIAFGVAALVNCAPAQALTVTSTDSVRIELGGLPGSVTFTSVQFDLGFGASNVFNGGESFHLSLFDAGGNLLGTKTSTAPFNLAGTTANFGVSTDNTAYAILDQVVGSFDLATVFGHGFPSGASGSLDFALVVPATETPLPGALALFAGGLGVIGVAARRRRRQQAVAAA